MPSMPTTTPIHQTEADVSQPFPENLEFDLEIDDSYDCVTNESLDIPQEILSKISDQTKTRLDFSTTLPLYHFKSNLLANIDQTSIKVVLKYPERSKYLLFDSKKPGTFFLLQGGRNDLLKVAGTTASFLARACYGIFTMFKRKHGLCGETKFVLLTEPIAVVNVPEVPTVRTALERYAYFDKKTNFIKLEELFKRFFKINDCQGIQQIYFRDRITISAAQRAVSQASLEVLADASPL
jgi:hypothetical protein